MRLLRRDGDRVTDAVLRGLIGKLRNRQAGGEPAVTVAAVHRIGAGTERLALPAAIRGVSGRLAVDDVGRNRQDALGVCGVPVRRMLADFSHETGDKLGCDLVDTVIVVAELRRRLVAFILIVDDKPGLVAGDANLAV